MKKVATFFAMASVIVALSSCGSKTAESTEATDSSAVVTETPMEEAPAPVADSSAMMTDTAAH